MINNYNNNNDTTTTTNDNNNNNNNTNNNSGQGPRNPRGVGAQEIVHCSGFWPFGL